MTGKRAKPDTGAQDQHQPDRITTKELARRKWEAIKRIEAQELGELLNDIVITDTPPDEI